MGVVCRLSAEAKHACARPGQAAGEQAGDGHPGDTEAFADLCLGEFVDEPHVNDLPVALVRSGDHRGERVEDLHQFRRLVVVAEEVRRGGLPRWRRAGPPRNLGQGETRYRCRCPGF